MALVAGASLLVGAGLAWHGRIPVPSVHDEFSYLLAADTFAHGRVTNPPHPLWQHFESFHIIQQPTYASKYPVGQGLSMALGQVLTGHPIAGVWLMIAMACMAITWMLRAFVPARWALAGGLLAAINPQVMRWEHNYWGGGVAMFAGAVLVGAARRFMERPSAASAAGMAFGGVVLANSRPFEGFIVALLIGGSVLAWMWRARRQLTGTAIRHACAGVAVVLIPAFGWMAYVNWRVTGDPLEMPYMRHEATYAVVRSFAFQGYRARPVYRHEVMRRHWVGGPPPTVTGESETTGVPHSTAAVASPASPPARRTPLWVWMRDWLNPMHRDKKVLFYSIALNPGLFVALAGLPFVLIRDPWGRWAAVMVALATPGILLGSWMFPHYAAPVVGLVFVVVIMSTRELAGRRLGRPLAMAVFAVSVAAFAVEYRNSILQDIASDGSWYRQRAKIVETLRASGEPALVVVRYAPDHPTGNEWVYNGADIDGSPVVWAREMDAAHNRELLDYFANRRIFLLEADAPEPTLVPVDRRDPDGPIRVLPAGTD